MAEVPHRPRFALNRRKVLLGLGLVAVSGIAQARLPIPNSPRIKTEKLTDMIPDRIGDFRFDTASGLILPPSDALSDRLYDNLVTRTYTNSDGKIVMLLVAYNNRQDGVLQIHRPEICYPAGGFSLTPTAPVDVPLGPGATLPGQIFSARGAERDEVVLYWTRVGNAFPRRWLEQRMVVAEANLHGVIPDGVLVRISTLAQDIEGELPLLQTFITDMYDQSPAQLRRLLFTA